METVAVIDFETTGLSPDHGDRATEIAAVIVAGGRVVDRYQSLMNAGVRIPPFIEALTGISDAMIRRAPPATEVMRAAADFVGDHPLVAHNAAFDRSFWCAELERAGREPAPSFACTMLLARRLYPQSANHRLATLAALHGIPAAGRAHRALADAQTAANLWLRMQHDVMRRFGLQRASHRLLTQLQRATHDDLARYVARHAQSDADATA